MSKGGSRLTVKNKAQVLNGLEFMLQRLEAAPVEVYRDVVTKVFRRVLNQTPQYTGEAVGSWVIGLDSPAPPPGDVGSPAWKVRAIRRKEAEPLQRGNRYWIEKAWQRERPKIALIQRRTKVFITNHAFGDTDNGRSSGFYLEDLQNPSYAAQKLRAANAPYEVVADSIAFVMARYWSKGIDPFKVRLSDSAAGLGSAG